MTRSRLLLVPAALAALTGLAGCVTQGFPNHGGGKRFYLEQHLVVRSAEGALEQIDWAEVPKAGPVRLRLVAMGDGQGAGVSSAADWLAPPGCEADGPGVDTGADLEYLKALIHRRLLEEGVEVAGRWHDPERVVGDLVVLVGEYGIARSGLQMIVYQERRLAARTSLDAFFLGKPELAGDVPGDLPLGRGGATSALQEEFVLFLGPINKPEERFSLQSGPIPGSE